MKSSTDTIAAQATARGRGALAIVRLSGASAREIAAGLLRHPQKFLHRESHKLQLVEVLSDDGSLLDQAMCVFYRAPHSYTGEDVVEFFLHGSHYIVDKTLERCCQGGARLAQPGEFTQRAFLNGRMDLAQAEAVADLIAASSAGAHRAAIAQREGALSARIRRVREKLLEICGLVELQIDFSDQESPIVRPERLIAILDEAEQDLKGLEASYRHGRLLREGANVVIAGAPNVGKSTLFNALLGQDKAIVDPLPGTTRDAVEGWVEWEGLGIRLLDTAGQGNHLLEADRQAVERAWVSARTADVVIWVLDLTDEASWAEPPEEQENRAIIVGNKADLIPSGSKASLSCIAVSALSGTGLETIKASVLEMLLPPEQEKEYLEHGILTRERHMEAVCRGREMLANARRAMEDNLGEELLAADLREVVNHLGEIIGEVTTDDILNRVFADFCIGK